MLENTEDKYIRNQLGRVIVALHQDPRVEDVTIWSNTVTFGIKPGYDLDDINNDIVASGLFAKRSEAGTAGGGYGLSPQEGISDRFYWVPSDFYHSDDTIKKNILNNIIRKKYKPWPYPKKRSGSLYVPKEKLNMELIGDMLGCF